MYCIKKEKNDMMRVPWIKYKHTPKTTGKDATARRKHTYADRCFECGATLHPTTRVAAHIDESACFPLFCGRRRTVLKTCCKQCNRNARSFWRCCVRPEDEALRVRYY